MSKIKRWKKKVWQKGDLYSEWLWFEKSHVDESLWKACLDVDEDGMYHLCVDSNPYAKDGEKQEFDDYNMQTSDLEKAKALALLFIE